MPSSDSLPSLQTFGDLLKYLRRRAQLTQRDLAIAVGYSEAQISRLEKNLRPPDLATLMALFIPALYLEDEPETIARLMELAAQARGERIPQNGQITFSQSVKREIKESTRTVEESPSNNLPIPLNSFIGREREIKEIKIFFNTSRLVTLTGIGGCGKTRLALETARELSPAYLDGIWLVELASVTNPIHISQTIISALSAPEPRNESPTAALKKYLQNKHLFLILDNCEQIIFAAAQLAEELLRACPQVQILATSREALGTAGEINFRVDPLPTNEFSDSLSDSARLFLERAKTTLPTFSLTKSNASFVAQICSRLDGIPLAIELAAARLNVLSVDQIAALLDDRFRLLTTGNRTAQPRQQTLLTAMDWSYDLLSEEDRKLFCYLSVFSGGFDLNAMKAIIADGESSTLDLLTRFVEKSLVVVDRFPNDRIRYRLLETVRAYLHGKLKDAGEESNIRERHLRHFLAFAEEANIKLRGEAHREWMMQLEHEHGNLRAGMEFAIESNAPELAEMGLQLALTLTYFWFLRGYHSERLDWFTRLLTLPHQPRNNEAYARALNFMGNWAADKPDALRLLDESLTLSHALKNEHAVAGAHLSRAIYGWMEDDPSTGQYHFEQSIALYRMLNDPWNLSHALVELGEFAQVRLDDRIVARNSFLESLQLSRELGDKRGIAFALVRLGDLAIEQGDLSEAGQCCSEGLVIATELNDRECMAWGLNDLGVVAMCEGRLDEAETLCVESLRLSQEWANAWHTVIRRYWLARVVAYQKDDVRAAALHEENRHASKDSDFDWGLAASLQGLGDIALRRGDLEQARSLHSDAILILHNGHYGYTLAYSLDSFAALALAKNQPERAVILLAAADALRESIHTALLPPEQTEREELWKEIRGLLSPEKNSSLTKQGRGLTHDEAVELALK